jgi:transposase
MFLRLVRATVSKGVKREYVRLVEAYRDRAGKTQHRTILNLGRKDLLAAHLDLTKLRRLLHGEQKTDCIKREDVGAIAAWDWGPMLGAQAIWRELGLDTMLNDHAGRERRDAAGLSDRALVLVANRLVSPGSEHALAQWLESDFVCDRHGRRFIAWRDDAERKASRTPRVRVKSQQLQQWYRTLDQLLDGKDAVERALFFRLRDLFSLQVDMVFYDLTSTYFEDAGPPELGANGHSRDNKPRNRQVLVGLVMVDGWPIAHHVFEGNKRDAKTVPDLRPIYHRTDDRVQAHIFVAALAFLLHRAIEKKLKAAGLDLSATQALAALKSVRVVEIDLGNGTTKRSVTRGTQRAASVLRALGISELDPPTPPQPGQTIM